MDEDRLLALSQSVAYGILHDRLKRHMRDERVRNLRTGFDPDAQPILKPNLLDGEIEPQKIELASKRDFLRLHIFQRVPE